MRNALIVTLVVIAVFSLIILVINSSAMMSNLSTANQMIDCIYNKHTIEVCEDTLGYTHSFKE